MATKFIAYAKVKNENHQWDEDFDVTSEETAETEVKETIEFFNDTLKPGELPRTFVELIKVDEVEEEDNEDDYFPSRDFDDFDDFDYDEDNY